jgi:peptidyl-Lys metalloendopeptidase
MALAEEGPRMARLIGLVVLMVAAWGLPASARTFERCALTDLKIADAAIDGAIEVTLAAAVAVGATPEYARWFGEWSGPRAEAVRANLKAVHGALAADDLVAVCLGPAAVDCKDGTYAYVLYDRPMAVNLCPSFFAMPTMRDAQAGRGDQANGTREGTIIHELSHFPDVAGTEDHCYSRAVCAELAGADPVRAIGNADSHQYFAEDVTIALVAKDG